MLAFMVAGFETTSSALNSCLYVLAKNEEQQQILQAEIDLHREENVNKDIRNFIYSRMNLKFSPHLFKERIRLRQLEQIRILGYVHQGGSQNLPDI